MSTKPGTVHTGKDGMNDASKQMTTIMARYLVQGSMLWWVLCPSQWLWRRVSTRTTASMASPQRMAKDVRKASREHVAESTSWRTLADTLQGVSNAHKLQTHS